MKRHSVLFLEKQSLKLNEISMQINRLMFPTYMCESSAHATYKNIFIPTIFLYLIIVFQSNEMYKM